VIRSAISDDLIRWYPGRCALVRLPCWSGAPTIRHGTLAGVLPHLRFDCL